MPPERSRKSRTVHGGGAHVPLPAVLAAAAVLLFLIALGDYLSGPEISFSLFYLAVIAMTAWTTGRTALTTVIASTGALLWLAAEWLSLGPASVGVVAWNATTRLVIFTLIGVLICRLRNALELAHELARTDHLTGLLNARAFEEIARVEISRARRYGHPLTVVYVDVDDFKSVNDRFGHSRGDDVLRAAAGTLKRSLRRSDSVCRIGGDEFVALLPETAADQAEDVIAKLGSSLASAAGELGVQVTFSMGAAVFTVPPADVDALIRGADSLMYRAKSAGKNCGHVAVQEPAIEPRRRLPH
ncbi:MAG TPA: GGDEF domain-containing protein [Gammaproteobacteria bacterium]